MNPLLKSSRKKKARCQRCGKPGELLCDSCLTKTLEKRMARELHNHELEKNTRIKATGLSRAVLLRLLSKRGRYRPKVVSGSQDITSLDSSIDDELEIFLSSWLTGRTKKGAKPRGIRLFKSLTDDELKRYSTLIGIGFKRRPGKFKAGLDMLETEHPGIKHSFVKSARAVMR